MKSLKKSLKAKKIVVIVQARLTSKRLPGKVLKKISGKPILQWVLDSVNKATKIGEVVIASPHPIPGFDVFIPSYDIKENDVLSRYYQCAIRYNADIIVRITADCPLIDGAWIDYCLEILDEFDYEYVSNTPFCPDGMDVEVFTIGSLIKANKKATSNYDREHVTPYIRKHFKMGELTHPTLNKYYDVKISIDTEQDLKRVRRIINEL